MLPFRLTILLRTLCPRSFRESLSMLRPHFWRHKTTLDYPLTPLTLLHDHFWTVIFGAFVLQQLLRLEDCSSPMRSWSMNKVYIILTPLLSIQSNCNGDEHIQKIQCDWRSSWIFSYPLCSPVIVLHALINWLPFFLPQLRTKLLGAQMSFFCILACARAREAILLFTSWSWARISSIFHDQILCIKLATGLIFTVLTTALMCDFLTVCQ